MLRIGLIGAGKWGRNFLRVLQNFPGVQLSYLASKNPEAASWVGPACQVVPRWEDLLAAEGLEGVVVAVPPMLHFPITMKAVELGIPILIEKPMTLNSQDALTLKLAVDQRQALFLVDHIHLFSPPYRALKTKVDSSQIRAIRGKGGGRGPFRPGFSPLWDYGPHDLSMALDLLGKPEAIVSVESFQEEQVEGNNGASYRVVLSWSGGRTAELTFGNTFSEKVRQLEVDRRMDRNDGETWVYDGLANQKLVVRKSGIEKGIPLSSETALENVVGCFIEGIRGHRAPEFGADLGLQVVEILSECERRLCSSQK